jgi:hypothetical protein
MKPIVGSMTILAFFIGHVLDVKKLRASEGLDTIQP